MAKSLIPLTDTFPNSTQVKAAGYDEARRRCAIQFKAQKSQATIYEYPDVSPEEYAGLLNAESAGNYVNQKIKPGRSFDRMEA